MDRYRFNLNARYELDLNKLPELNDLTGWTDEELTEGDEEDFLEEDLSEADADDSLVGDAEEISNEENFNYDAPDTDDCYSYDNCSNNNPVDTGGDAVDYTDRFVTPMVFTSIDEAFEWAKSVVHGLRFGIIRADTKHRKKYKMMYYKIICEKVGDYRASKSSPDKIKRSNTSTKKTGYKFGFTIRSIDNGESFFMAKAKSGCKLNHDFLRYTDGHRKMAKLTTEHIEFREEEIDAGVPNKNIRASIIKKWTKNLLGKPSMAQVRYQASKIKEMNCEGRNPAQNMLHYAKLANYRTSFETHEDDKLTQVFMVHPVGLEMLRSWHTN